MKLNLKKGLPAQAGFTLIELLVVIAIIGILSAVVLSSLGSARTKAKDAAAQSSMAQARAGAEIAFSNNSNSYANICPTITNFEPTAAGTGDTGSEFYKALSNGRKALTTAAGAAGDTNATVGAVTCSSVAGAYAATVHLNVNNYCVDSTGFAGIRTTNGLSSQACPAS